MAIAGRDREESADGVHRLWRFGHAELDERTLELRIKGESTALEPKPLEVLFHLLRHAGEVVTKDELAEACWPRRILSESVLTKTVSRLREVLQDDDQGIIRTVHGYGYRLVAKVSISASGSEKPAPKLNFVPGSRLAIRQHWVLTERLGSGRSGEAWLVVHEHTGERRVFKFPLDLMGLSSLKREITLSRLLAEPAGDRVARVLDWNLELEPYFLEYEYAAGGNLLQWAERQGGLPSIPQEIRIDWAIQIAEALAIAHAVGVLHKDLKPANVLLDPVSLRIKLADFGSGGILDTERLEALGITRLGFTRTLAVDAASSGTPLYVAPEVLAGQPATVQGDIYALGVMLYQLVVGDFRRPLAAGWEHEVRDEVLRDDIAAAAAGDALRRMVSAGTLAEQLRHLEQRRQQRHLERQERNRMEAERHAMERARARRKWVIATMVVLVIGLLTSSGLFLEARQAKRQAVRAAATSKAVSRFLSDDIFNAVSTVQKPPREWTVIDLLNAASSEVDQRFVSQPEVAAELHSAMGGAFLVLEEIPSSELHLRRALELNDGEAEPSIALSMNVAAKLVVPDYLAGRLQETVKEYASLFEEGVSLYGPADPAVQRLRNSLSWSYSALGDWAQSLALMRQQMILVQQNPATDPREHANALRNLGASLIDGAEFDEAELILREANERLSGLKDSSPFSMFSLRTMAIDLAIQRGRYDKARREIEEARSVAKRWTPKDQGQFESVLLLLEAQLLVEEQEAAKALKIVDALSKALGPGAGESIDQRWMAMELGGQAYAQMGRLHEAEASLVQALPLVLRASGQTHPWALRVRLALVEVLVRNGKVHEAQSALDALHQDAPAALPEGHPLLAEYSRVKGLLNFAQGQPAKARAEFKRAALMYQKKLGDEHWKTRRVLNELAAL